MTRASRRRDGGVQPERSMSRFQTIPRSRTPMLAVLAAVFVAMSSNLTNGSAAHASALVAHPVFAPGISLAGVDCTWATDCTAVGAEGSEPIHATEISGDWGVAIATSSVMPAQFNDISCTSPRVVAGQGRIAA